MRVRASVCSVWDWEGLVGWMVGGGEGGTYDSVVRCILEIG